MQAVILAAGEGIRLRPYTQLIPKPLMTIGGIPLITYHIDKLNSLGIENEKIVVVISHLKEEVEGFLKRFHAGVRVTLQLEKKGTAAALECAKPFIEDEEMIVCYGDVFFEDDLKDFVKNESAIAVHEVEDVSKFGKIVEEKGYLKEIREKSEIGRGYIFAGLLKTKKEIFEAIKCVKPNEKSKEYYLTDAILIQNEKTPFKIYKLKGKWFDIGNERSLIEARKFNLCYNSTFET
jgi:NDP-sugar pyrophosphorylase family protein